MSKFFVKRNIFSEKLGFTLVETIVSLALFTILMLAVMQSVGVMYGYNAYTLSQAYQVQNARLGMQSLIRDIREMTYADDGTFPIAIMDTDKIGFYSDIDRDNSVEYVEYELISSSTLKKMVFNATGSPPTYDTSTPDETFTLSEYVQNINYGTSTFKYFDDEGIELFSASNLTDVRYIVVQIIVNIDPIRDPGEFMLRSSAALRNIKENI